MMHLLLFYWYNIESMKVHVPKDILVEIVDAIILQLLILPIKKKKNYIFSI